MKKSLLFLAFLSLSFGLYAQFSYGVKAGLNLSRMQMTYPPDDAAVSFGFTPSFHVGMYSSIDVSEKFAFSGDFLISDKGYKEKSAVHLLYASIPIMAQFKPIKNLSVGLGPTVGILITTWGKDRELTKDFYTNHFDFGAAAGLQYSITSSIAIALRFEQGFSNVIGKDTTIPYYRYINEGDPLIISENARDLGFKSWNQSFQLSVCYALK
jgi:Outer membrane protein beta-barrel domain